MTRVVASLLVLLAAGTRAPPRSRQRCTRRSSRRAIWRWPISHAPSHVARRMRALGVPAGQAERFGGDPLFEGIGD
jgi:hypothetical protein